eukprot:jgi/Ulvmu1/12037/UM083_0050.1
MMMLSSRAPHSLRASLHHRRGDVIYCAQRASMRTQLGQSDLHVSECCLGTMTWGEQNTEADAHEQLSHAFELGINFLDAAEMYPVPAKAETQGLTERYIGTWLPSKRRNDAVIATKVSGYSYRSWVRDARGTVRVTPEQIQEAVDKSLSRLGVDYVDLLQIHWPDRYVPLFGTGRYDRSKRQDAVPFEEQLRGLQNVIRQGKVRYIGVSNETSWGISRFVQAAEIANLPRIQTIQNSYSLVWRSDIEGDLAEACAESDVSLLA